MNGPLTTLLAGGALAVVVVGASIASNQQDSADEPPVVAETSPTSVPTRTPETQATESPPPTPEPPTPTKQKPEPPPNKELPTTFVGRVDGGRATLAVVVDGAEAAAYFCDGADLESWLSGSATDGRIELSGDNGALSAKVDGRRANGSVRVEGRRFGFTLRQVDLPQGLYRVAETISGAEVSGGWILLPGGRQIGVLTVDGRSRPAPKLNPATGRVRVAGRTVMAQPQGSGW